MKPLFLGSAAKRLYGVYHSPARASRHAVLLCYPGMQEYDAAHWAFRRLAAMLGREGHHVLRFDYFGTGDSSGDSAEGSPAEWVQDVQLAAQELKDLSGAREVSLVGMRLGAALATLACAEGLKARRLLLWEPVIRGRSYVRELELWDERRNLALLHADRTRGRRDELMGFPFPHEVRRAIEALDLNASAPLTDKAVIFTTEARAEHRALCASFERAGVATSVQTVADASTNINSAVRERALLSNAVLLDMVQELRGQLPT